MRVNTTSIKSQNPMNVLFAWLIPKLLKLILEIKEDSLLKSALFNILNIIIITSGDITKRFKTPGVKFRLNGFQKA